MISPEVQDLISLLASHPGLRVTCSNANELRKQLAEAQKIHPFLGIVASPSPRVLFIINKDLLNASPS